MQHLRLASFTLGTLTLTNIDNVSIMKSSACPTLKRGGITCKSYPKHASINRELTPARSLLTSHLGRPIFCKSSLWAKAINHRYNLRVSTTSQSFISKNLLHVRDLFSTSTAWSHIYGQSIYFWHHHWIDKNPSLRNILHSPLNDGEHHLNISTLWNGSNRDFSKLPFDISRNILAAASKIILCNLARGSQIPY